MDDKELQKLLDDVAKDVAVMLKSETMSKAHPGESVPAEKSPDESETTSPSSDGGSSDAPPPPAAGGDAPPADSSASGPPASPSGDGAAPPADPSASGMGGDPAMGGGEIDADALSQEYSQMPLEDLKVHYLAVKAALAGKMPADGMGGAPGASPGASAPPAAPPAPMGGSPAAPPAVTPEPPPAMGKAEIEKAEKAAATARAETEALRKTVAGLEQAAKARDEQLAKLSGIVEAVRKGLPAQKAVTGQDIRKSETAVAVEDLSDGEVRQRLNAVARRTTLKKSDRDLIDRYCVGKAKVEDIKHLLVEVAA